MSKTRLGSCLYLVAALAAASGASAKAPFDGRPPWQPQPVKFDEDVTSAPAPLLTNTSFAPCDSGYSCGDPEPSGCKFNNTDIDTAGIRSLRGEFVFKSDLP